MPSTTTAASTASSSSAHLHSAAGNNTLQLQLDCAKGIVSRLQLFEHLRVEVGRAPHRSVGVSVVAVGCRGLRLLATRGSRIAATEYEIIARPTAIIVVIVK